MVLLHLDCPPPVEHPTVLDVAKPHWYSDIYYDIMILYYGSKAGAGAKNLKSNTKYTKKLVLLMRFNTLSK